jgi:uncharacterized protein YbaP (TraB family)
MRRYLLASAAFVFLSWTAAGAVSEPPAANAPPVTDWVPDETVVVSAQGAGPAFWHIKKGDAEIWVLGTVTPLPKGMSWNSAHLGDIVKGARAVLTPPTASSGLFETSWFLLTHRGLLSMPDDKKLDDTLPPDLRARLAAQRTALKLKADEYDDDPPILAAMKLQGAFNKVHQLDSDEPLETVKRLAKESHVPVRAIGEYGALGLVKEGLRLPQESQRVCLEESVSYAESRSVHNVPLASAWAAGNLKEIKAHYVPGAFEKCIKQMASFGKLTDRAVADYLKAIHEALAQPGKVVMLTDIGSLLRTTGVAEALHKEGIVIEGPAE